MHSINNTKLTRKHEDTINTIPLEETSILLVGDSHEGPLKNRGESCLKPAKNANADQLTHLTCIHSTTTVQVAPTARQDNTGDAPRREVRLARGVDAPSGEVRLARRPYAPSGGVRLARGLNHAPRTRSASLEGWAPPRSGPAPLEGTRARLPRLARGSLTSAPVPHACTGL
jgi:hypothetical protein